jgi:hypothetical protein
MSDSARAFVACASCADASDVTIAVLTLLCSDSDARVRAACRTGAAFL